MTATTTTPRTLGELEADAYEIARATAAREDSEKLAIPASKYGYVVADARPVRSICEEVRS